jgi:SAM-dependent methyltransferase
MDIIQANIYDYPKYYDVLFASDWAPEYRFLRGCFEKHAKRPVRRLFEPACGTGRLLYRFAQAGYEVAGNDLNPKAVDYCNARFVRHGFAPAAIVGDMSDFRLRPKADAAFNTINSFRHLQTQAQAEGHLRCVAEALNRGGLYMLGLHLTPASYEASESEFWSSRKGHLEINSKMWTLSIDRRRRQERVKFEFDVYTPTRQFRLADEFNFRTYTRVQMQALIAAVPSLEVVETYDFAYKLKEPIVLDDQTEDVVFVLRKR